MRVNVWVDSWQIECCGEQFAVGSAVAWPADPEESSAWLDELDGPAPRISYRYEAHSDEPVLTVAGTITRIRALKAGQLTDLDSDRRWDFGPLAGWIVELEVG